MRETTRQENRYMFPQNRDIMNTSGLIGIILGNYGPTGDRLNLRRFPHQTAFKTKEIKTEIEGLISLLFGDGGILHDCDELARFYYSGKTFKAEDGAMYCGVRIDTAGRAYLLRMTPDTDSYNLYWYCYDKRWLDARLKAAKQGVKVVDVEGNELFRVEDGGMIRIFDLNVTGGIRYKDTEVEFID